MLETAARPSLKVDLEAVTPLPLEVVLVAGLPAPRDVVLVAGLPAPREAVVVSRLPLPLEVVAEAIARPSREAASEYDLAFLEISCSTGIQAETAVALDCSDGGICSAAISS